MSLGALSSSTLVLSVALALGACASQTDRKRASPTSGASAAVPKTTLEVVRFPGDVQREVVSGKVALARFVAPTKLTLRVGPPRVDGPYVRISALLSNPAAEPFVIPADDPRVKLRGGVSCSTCSKIIALVFKTLIVVQSSSSLPH